MWVIDDKCGTLLGNAGNLAYMGEPLVIVDRGPGSVSDIFGFELFLFV